MDILMTSHCNNKRWLNCVARLNIIVQMDFIHLILQSQNVRLTEGSTNKINIYLIVSPPWSTLEYVRKILII